MALIETERLSRAFRRGSETINALIDVSVAIESGEFVAITGPSGSGKSTLMHILGLLDRQTSGSYRLNGVLTDNLSDDECSALRNETIGFVFQSFHLLPRASAIENVALPVRYSPRYRHGMPRGKVDARAREALRMVGLNDRDRHEPSELSGGQRQRVAIARALVNAPRIVFADEPTGNLDSVSSREIMKLFTELNAQGITIIIVTHDPSVAAVARRVLVFNDGRIAEDRRESR